MEQGSKLPGRGRKTSAMDWKSIRKTLNTGIGEPVSRFTCVALDADGRWMRWEQRRISRDLLELLKPHRQETGGAWAGLGGEEQDQGSKSNTTWERNGPCSGAWVRARWWQGMAEIRD